MSTSPVADQSVSDRNGPAAWPPVSLPAAFWSTAHLNTLTLCPAAPGSSAVPPPPPPSGKAVRRRVVENIGGRTSIRKHTHTHRHTHTDTHTHVNTHQHPVTPLLSPTFSLTPISVPRWSGGESDKELSIPLHKYGYLEVRM